MYSSRVRLALLLQLLDNSGILSFHRIAILTWHSQSLLGYLLTAFALVGAVGRNELQACVNYATTKIKDKDSIPALQVFLQGDIRNKGSRLSIVKQR